MSRGDTGEEIYANVPDITGQQAKEPPRSQKPNLIVWAVVSLAVLCFLLLVVNVALGVSSSSERNELQSRICGLAEMALRQYAVNITLDPETAHRDLQLSADGKKVVIKTIRQNVTHNKKRFKSLHAVLAKQGFSSGRFYYEVQVSGMKDWTIGVVRESIDRSSSVTKSPKQGVWAFWLRDGGRYSIHGVRNIVVPENERPERVGVFVDYEAGLVSFYDALRWRRLGSLIGFPFDETIYPYFYIAKDESPMIIIDPTTCKK